MYTIDLVEWVQGFLKHTRILRHWGMQILNSKMFWKKHIEIFFSYFKNIFKFRFSRLSFIKPWSIHFEWMLLWLVACLTFYHSSRLLRKIPIECLTFVQQTLEKNFCDVISRVHFQRDYSDQLHFWTTLKWCHVPWILVTPN